MLTRVLINFVLLAVLSLICGIVLDHAISYGIAGYYRPREPYASMDAPTFEEWKASLHHCILLGAWVLLSLVIIIWRFFTISFWPKEIPFMKKIDHFMNQTALVEADSQELPRSSQSFPDPRARIVHDHRQDMASALSANLSISQSPSDLRSLQQPPSSTSDEPNNLRSLPSIQSPIEMYVPPPNNEQHLDAEGQPIEQQPEFDNSDYATTTGKVMQRGKGRQIPPKSSTRREGTCSDTEMVLQPSRRNLEGLNTPRPSVRPSRPALSTGPGGTESGIQLSRDLEGLNTPRPSVRPSRPAFFTGPNGIESGIQLSRNLEGLNTPRPSVRLSNPAFSSGPSGTQVDIQLSRNLERLNISRPSVRLANPAFSFGSSGTQAIIQLSRNLEGLNTSRPPVRLSNPAFSFGPSGTQADIQLSLPEIPTGTTTEWDLFGEWSSSSSGNLHNSPPTSSTQAPSNLEDNESLPSTPTGRPRSIARNLQTRPQTSSSFESNPGLFRTPPSTSTSFRSNLAFFRTPPQILTRFQSELLGTSSSITNASTRYEEPLSEPGLSGSAAGAIRIPDLDGPIAENDEDIIARTTVMPESENQDDTMTKEELSREIESWGDLVPFQWEDLVIFNPLRERSPTSLQTERRCLEEACAQKRVMNVERFEVYGIRRFWEHDRLKCWVLLGMYHHFNQVWPEGYVPETPMRELTDGQVRDDDGESNFSFF